jgi:ribosomal protein S18 acetylase RimI-like enzyme
VSDSGVVVRRVVAAEEFYSGHGAAARFQISPGACPDGLDADWAGAHEADRMYLQVERDNVPALRLYERTGFSELCGYHYRTAG